MKTSLPFCKAAKHSIGTCLPARLDSMSGNLLEKIVRDYREHRGEKEELHLQFYARQPTLADAIRKASLAEMPGGGRVPHQRRIPRAALKRACDTLLRQDYACVCSFSDLHTLCTRALSRIKGIGELTIYDTAHRLGAYLRLRPEHVYLHAGVRVGARALGLGHNKDKLAMNELPRPFQKLLPEQAEDCLCIYKTHLMEWAEWQKKRA